MITLNKSITKDEARNLITSKSGVFCPDTDHNKKMLAEVMHENLVKLRADQP